jgi:hypothetical protein
LDALVDYGVVADNPTREVPNPKWNALNARLREARAELAGLQAQYGRLAFGNPEARRPTMRGFKIAQGKLGRALRAATRRLSAVLAQRAAVPKRVPVQDLFAEEVVKLAPERKHLTSLIKMLAYQAETERVRLVAPHDSRVEDEGRTLIQSALAAPADLEVTDKELCVRIAPLSSAHRTRAIAALCEELNRTPTCFPGTRLRLRYAVGPAR